MSVTLGTVASAIGVQQLGAVPDDAAVLLRRAGQEARHVDEREQRDVERVAEPHEPRRLGRRVDVEAAGQVLRLVGDHADALAPEPHEADHDVRRVRGVDLQEPPSSASASSPDFMS
jgi:hypothetical protein